MLKIGDIVTVPAGDMKERKGTLEKVDNDLAYIAFDNGTSSCAYQLRDIRKVGAPTLKVATKHDQNKNRLELIPVSGIEGIGRAMTFGSKKYADHNWAKGFDYSRLCGSAMRHLLAWMSGQDKDPESGLSHLDHLGACVVMLIAHETEGLGSDDRRKTNN